MFKKRPQSLRQGKLYIELLHDFKSFSKSGTLWKFTFQIDIGYIDIIINAIKLVAAI